MKQAYRHIRKDFAREMLKHLLRRFHGLGFGFLNHGIHNISLPAEVDFAATAL